MVITGLVLQVEYHMHGLPDDCCVLGLDRRTWLLFHRVWAAVLAAGIVIHCRLHEKNIIAAMRSIRRFKPRLSLSMYVLFLMIPTVLTATISWFFFNPGDQARFALVEIHDKLALLLGVLSCIHIGRHTGWMIGNLEIKNKRT